jgi:hypothetical protein
MLTPSFRLQGDAEKRKHNVTDKPFKTAGCIPKSSTPGDFYGTSGKIPYMPVREVSAACLRAGSKVLECCQMCCLRITAP